MEPQTTEKKPGVFNRSWSLMKSGWHVLKLDKELMALPIISTLVSIAVMIAVVASLILFAYSIEPGQLSNSEGWTAEPNGAIAWAIMIPFYIVGAFIVNFFSAALIYGALQRFNGGDPTVRGSIKAAAHRWRPLLFFSLVSGIVAIILDVIRDWASRLPLGGQIVGYLFAFLGNLAWAAATFFALPHIMTSEKELNPKEAISASIKTLKGSWGESAVTYAGVGIVSVLVALVLIGSFVGFEAAAAAASLGMGAMIGIGLVGVVALLGFIVLSTTLESIIKAAVFHYATTGEAPAEFDKRMLRAAMTPKKARGIFNGRPKGGTWAS